VKNMAYFCYAISLLLVTVQLYAAMKAKCNQEGRN
jgi:hypothetical protein